MTALLLVLCIVASGLLWGSAVAQEQPAGLEGLQGQYESHLTLLKRPLTELATNYEKALTALRDDLQKKADLDGLIGVKQEFERFEKTRSPNSKISKVEALARIQNVYATSHGAASAKVKEQTVAAHAAYRGRLEALVRILTTKGDLDGALKVRAALEKLGPAKEEKVTLETGLVLHFRFEADGGEVVRDESGAGNDGRLMGDAKIASGGNRGRYLALDGRGDFVECPHDDSLTLTTDGSISLWIRPERLVQTRGLVSKYTPKNSYTLRTWAKTDYRRVSFGDFEHENHTKAELRENKWTHVAVTLADGKVQLYLDGTLDSEGTRPAPLVTNTSAVHIGSDYDGRYFHGSIDDVRIYRRALTEKEVTEIFQIES